MPVVRRLAVSCPPSRSTPGERGVSRLGYFLQKGAQRLSKRPIPQGSRSSSETCAAGIRLSASSRLESPFPPSSQEPRATSPPCYPGTRRVCFRPPPLWRLHHHPRRYPSDSSGTNTESRSPPPRLPARSKKLSKNPIRPCGLLRGLRDRPRGRAHAPHPPAPFSAAAPP